MKKHLFLTSLVALIATVGTAKATDVTFSGKYITSDGETVADINNVVAEPELSAFDYKDVEGNDATLATEGTEDIVRSDYIADSTFDPENENGVSIADNYKLISGVAIDASKYFYTYGDESLALNLDTDGNVVLSQDYMETVALLAEDAEPSEAISVQDSVIVKNGVAEGFDGTLFTVEDSGQKYSLNADGTKLVRFGTNEEVNPTGDLAALKTELIGLYNAAKTDVDAAIESTAADSAAERTAANYAKAVYDADQTVLAGLDENWETLVNAKANYQAAVADFAAYEEAAELYNASITDTVNTAIETANASVHGKIHGLITEENGVKKFNGTGKVASTRLDNDGNYVGDLAVGTTTEEHLVSLDNAIGNEVARATAAEAALDNRIGANTQAISGLNNKVDSLEKNVSGGVAAATALSAVEVSNVKKGEMSVGGGYGYYNNQSAMAFGAAMGLSDRWSVNAGAGIASGDKTQMTFRAGTNYKFKLF